MSTTRAHIPAVVFVSVAWLLLIVAVAYVINHWDKFSHPAIGIIGAICLAIMVIITRLVYVTAKEERKR